jgi:hypothetical protein
MTITEIEPERRNRVSLRFSPAVRRACFAQMWRLGDGAVDPEFDDATELIAQIGRTRRLGTVEAVPAASGDGLRAFAGRHPGAYDGSWEELGRPACGSTAPPPDKIDDKPTRAERLQREYEAEEYTRRREKESESSRLWWAEDKRRTEAARQAEARLAAAPPPTPAELALARERAERIEQQRQAEQRRTQAIVAHWREHYERQAAEREAAL